MLTYGIGLKQVCDVAVMLRNASLDKKKLVGILRELNMIRFSRVLFGFIDVYIKGVRSFRYGLCMIGICSYCEISSGETAIC